MWGLHDRRKSNLRTGRFTPTYVGTSSAKIIYSVRPSVHPHVCGDFRAEPDLCNPSTGSPPRMWGLLGDLVKIVPADRFTPTYVGTSQRPD